MHQFFVSYAREDSEIKNRVCAYLSNLGLVLWTDENLTPETESWTMAIGSALDKSKGLIVLLSPDAKSSRWVDRELNYAQGSARIPIYPILVRGDDSNARPIQVASHQYTDLRNMFEEPLTKLVHTINKYTLPNREKIETDPVTDPLEILATAPRTEAEIYERSYLGEARHNWSIHLLKDVLERNPKGAEVNYGKGGAYPVYGVNGIVEYSETYQYDGDYLLVQNAGSGLISSGYSSVNRADGKFAVKSSITVVGLRDPSLAVLDYIFAFLLTLDLRQAVKGYSSPKLDWTALDSLPIALPSIEGQKRLASIIRSHQDVFQQKRRSLETEIEALSQLDRALLMTIVNGN